MIFFPNYLYTYFKVYYNKHIEYNLKMNCDDIEFFQKILFLFMN